MPYKEVFEKIIFDLNYFLLDRVSMLLRLIQTSFLSYLLYQLVFCILLDLYPAFELFCVSKLHLLSLPHQQRQKHNCEIPCPHYSEHVFSFQLYFTGFILQFIFPPLLPLLRFFTILNRQKTRSDFCLFNHSKSFL